MAGEKGMRRCRLPAIFLMPPSFLSTDPPFLNNRRKSCVTIVHHRAHRLPAAPSLVCACANAPVENRVTQPAAPHLQPSALAIDSEIPHPPLTLAPFLRHINPRFSANFLARSLSSAQPPL